MTSTAGGIDRDHPILAVLAQVEAALAAVAATGAWTLSGEQARAALVDLTRVRARMAELQLRVLVHADQIKAGEETGATSTANWWAHTTRTTRSQAHQQVRLARALATHEPVRAALAAGDVLPDQAQVICEAVDALPESHAECEGHLLEQADHFDAKGLRILGRRVLAVVDPDAGDAHEATLLEAEERAADKATRLVLHDDGHGLCHGRFTLPSTTAVILRRQLMALAAPKHRRGTGHTYDHTRPTPQRLGQAFAEHIEAYPTGKLPATGGQAATVVVTIPLAVLEGRLAGCSLDTGHRLTPGAARRLACQAGIIPAVLGTDSEILDLGHRARFFSRPQRLAATLAQPHCRHPGCDTPAAHCHSHHREPWAHGGTTDQDDLILLCPRHHALAHRPTPLRT